MDHNRLRWASRRGMLELDLLLTTFVERGYARAGAADQARFERLLACEDQDLFGWLMGRTEAPDADLRAIVALVLDVCRTTP